MNAKEREAKKDRFEELWDRIFHNYENIADITMDQMIEMLGIYRALKLQREKKKGGNILKLQKELGDLLTSSLDEQLTDVATAEIMSKFQEIEEYYQNKIEDFEASCKQYLDVIGEKNQEIEKLQKENETLKNKILAYKTMHQLEGDD